MQYSLRPWKNIAAALCLFATVGLTGCDQKADTTTQNKAYDGLTQNAPLRVDAQAHTVTILVQVNGRFFTEGTRHAVIYNQGSNDGKALFTAYASPKAFYEALTQINATPGNNMTGANAETTHVAGSKLAITVNWAGAARPYTFDEVIADSKGKKLDMRFGGNLQNAEMRGTGCLICLDSCPVGIVSNATYTYGAVEKRDEVTFKGRPSILPPDGTLATITLKVVD